VPPYPGVIALPIWEAAVCTVLCHLDPADPGTAIRLRTLVDVAQIRAAEDAEEIAR